MVGVIWRVSGGRAGWVTRNGRDQYICREYANYFSRLETASVLPVLRLVLRSRTLRRLLLLNRQSSLAQGTKPRPRDTFRALVR